MYFFGDIFTLIKEIVQNLKIPSIRYYLINIKNCNITIKKVSLYITYLPYQVELARHFLTRSIHPFLSFIAVGISSILQPVSSRNWSMYVLSGCPRGRLLWFGCQRSTGLYSYIASLLHWLCLLVFHILLIYFPF